MKLATVLEDVQAAASRCLRDARCTYGSWPENQVLCPIYQHDPSFTFSGGGYLFLILALLDNKIDFDQSTADFAFSCTGCMACESNCHLIPAHPPYAGIMDIIRLLRSEAVRRGFIPGGVVKQIYDEVKERGDHGQATDLPLPAKIKDDGADTVIFAECAHTASQDGIFRAAVKLLEKISGRPAKVRHDPPRAGDILHSQADISLDRKHLGYEPLVNYEEGLRRTWEWYKSNSPR